MPLAPMCKTRNFAAMTPLSRRHLPSHTILRTFEAAARHESFTLAAQELNLTQGAISRQVKELEQSVGTELFQRVGRRVLLTTAGRNLASDLAIDLQSLENTLSRAISAGAMGTALRIATLPTFASRWLIPRLPEFFRDNPAIEINLYTRLTPFDLRAEQFDLAIHFGQANWPDGEMVPLCSEQLVAVATPELKQRYGLNGIQDLQGAPLLHMAARPAAWLDYFAKAGIQEPGLARGKYFDQFTMIIAAARASLGCALLPSYLIEEEIDNGSLLKLGGAEIDTNCNYYLVTPLGQENGYVKSFQNWMLNSVTAGSLVI